MDLGRALSWTAERYPRRRAVGGADAMTYAVWEAHTNRLARALAASGVRPRGRVALLLTDGESMASLHFAAQKLGAVSVPLSTRFGSAELAYCVRDAEPVLLVTDASTTGMVEEALGEEFPVARAHVGATVDAPHGATLIDELATRQSEDHLGVRVSDSDLSVMLYTAGTTGQPKGVPRTHAAEHQAAVAHLLQTGQRMFETTLGVMPMFHTMGLRSLLASVISAGTWVPQARFEADRTLELIADEGVTTLYLVPTMYWGLLQTGRLGEATSVRKLAYAGASMTPTLAEQLTGTLQPEAFVNHFGSTEVYTFTIGSNAAAKPGCAGRAGIFSRVRLVDPTPDASPQDVVAAGEQGQIAVSMDSPEAFSGYWQRPDADAKSIRQGWYFPGDLATTDGDGDFWVSGRVDDMINSGGENIYPGEIEAALARCPAVADVVVVGLPDDRWGQATTAFFVPAVGISPDHAATVLAQFVREQSGLPSMKRPKRLIAVEHVPKSAVGKILRRELTTGHYCSLAEAPAEALSPNRR